MVGRAGKHQPTSINGLHFGNQLGCISPSSLVWKVLKLSATIRARQLDWSYQMIETHQAYTNHLGMSSCALEVMCVLTLSASIPRAE